MTDTTGFGAIDPSLLERIRKTERPRQVVFYDEGAHIQNSAEWWHHQNRTYAENNIPRRYAHATTDLTVIHEWVYGALREPESAPSLLLAGPTGTGKTHAAFAALRLCAEAIRPIRFKAASTAALLGDLRPSAGRDSEALMKQYCADPLLFLDDLGAAKGSDWTEEILYRVVDYRYSNCLPCIFATNFEPGELSGRLGDRTASRLAEMCQVLPIEGKDRRRPQ